MCSTRGARRWCERYCIGASAKEGGKDIRIEHPSGHIDVTLTKSGHGSGMIVEKVGIVRTARKIMEGKVFVPAHVWPSDGG